MKTNHPQKPSKPYNFERSAKERLRHYRALQAFYQEHYQADPQKTWREYRYVKPEWLDIQYPATAVRTSEDKDCWYCDQFPFKELGYCDELNNTIQHRGWFTDNHCGESYRGVVLVGRIKGAFGFIPAVTHSDWDGKTLWIGDFEPLEDAHQWGTSSFNYAVACRRVASQADSYAERLAEEAREDDAKFQAEVETERLAEERSELRKQALALIKEIKAAHRRFTPAVCEVLTEKLQSLRRQIRKKRERSAALADNYWLAVEN